MRRAFRLPGSRARIARELDDEVRFHVEMRAKALEGSGMSREAAWAEATRKFGDIDDLRDYCVSMEVAQMQRVEFREWMHSIGQDMRFALRQWRKAPGFAAIAALTLALGVGATTAIFTVVNGVVLRPLPFGHPEQILQVWGLDSKRERLMFADPTFDHLAAENRSLSAVAEYNEWGMSLSIGREVIRAQSSQVTKQFFDVLGVQPALGRFFAPEEQRIGGPMAVVISDRLWREQFGASPSVIGSIVHNGPVPATVVGVLHPGQEYPAAADIWYPRELEPKNDSYTGHNWRVVARMKDGVTPAQANRDVSMVLRRVHAAVGDRTWTFDGVAIPLLEQVVGNVKLLLFVALGAAGVLLLIACANVANLLIARLASRESELAVRLALGAGRGRLAQQLLAEASLLAFAGCNGGLVIALAGMRLLLALRPDLIPRVGELSIDWRVLSFAMLLSAATAIALGLFTAWRGARGDLRAALSQSQRSHGGGAVNFSLRGSLVVTQLAMTVVLLIAAGLLARSFVRLMTIDPGYRTHGVVVAGMMFEPGTAYDSVRIADRTRYFDQLADQAHAIPGVTQVGITDSPPFSGGSSNGTFLVLPSVNAVPAMKDLEALYRDKTRTGWAGYRMASPGFFKALGIPLLTGRMFDDRDVPGAPHVALVNAALARKQWPNESAIGKVLEYANIDGDLTPMTIVGIVGDTREQDLTQPADPMVYTNYRQRRDAEDMVVVLSTPTEAATITAARRVFKGVRSDVPMRFDTIERIIGESVASQRFMLLVVGIFGAVALVLATLGVYGVISYLVAQRGRELSIRVALGASRTEIVRLVLRQGVVLAVIGAVVGAVAGLGASQLLKHLLYQVSTADPVAFAGVLVALCAIASVASYIPARRASRLAPMDVLRSG